MRSLILAIAVVATCSNAFAEKDRGGGCIVANNSSTQLLDFAVYGAKPDRTPGVQIKLTPAAQLIGIDVLSTESKLQLSPVVWWLNYHLAKWNSNSPVLVQALTDGLKTLPLYISPFEFNKLESSCPVRGAAANSKVQLAVAYAKDSGAMISVPAFNKLALLDQAGLLLHETLRSLQVQSDRQLDDSAIQDLTYTLIYRPPNSVDLRGFLANSHIGKMSDDLSTLMTASQNACKKALAISAVQSIAMNRMSCNQLASENQDEFLKELYDLSSDAFQNAIAIQDLSTARIIKKVMDEIAGLSISGNRIAIERIDTSSAVLNSGPLLKTAVGSSLIFSSLNAAVESKKYSSELQSYVDQVRVGYEDALQSGVISNPGGYSPNLKKVINAY